MNGTQILRHAKFKLCKNVPFRARLSLKNMLKCHANIHTCAFVCGLMHEEIFFVLLDFSSRGRRRQGKLFGQPKSWAGGLLFGGYYLAV